MKLNIVLVEPEIPPNTGNIARTCAATNCKLHLVKPLGFSLDEKQVRRAGLDYWSLLDLEVHESLQAFLDKYGDQQLFCATTKADKFYSDVEYKDDSFILFGKETKGLPAHVLDINRENNIRIPMVEIEQARSLNLSNSVNIIMFEALRQGGFENLV